MDDETFRYFLERSEAAVALDQQARYSHLADIAIKDLPRLVQWVGWYRQSIAALEAENSRLGEALQVVGSTAPLTVGWPGGDEETACPTCEGMIERARAALAGGTVDGACDWCSEAGPVRQHEADLLCAACIRGVERERETLRAASIAPVPNSEATCEPAPLESTQRHATRRAPGPPEPPDVPGPRPVA
jgi:hypothetical protein